MNYIKNGRYVESDGSIRYYRNGELHLKNGPAVIYLNGTTEWHLNGKLHRENSPAIEYSNGDNEWYVNDKIHRLDGPAYKCRGKEKWYFNGIEIDCKTQKEFERIIRLKAFW